jgi:hypothetical protein
MRRLQFFDHTFDRLFSEANKKRVEHATLWTSLFGFMVHLTLIYAKKFEWFNSPFEMGLLDDPISSLYTPFSIILVYEIYLLVVYLPRSFTTSVSKQFEIISLILIRRIFGDFPKIDLSMDWFASEANIQLIYDLIGVLLVYFLIYQFNKSWDQLPKKELSPRLKRFVAAKKGVSVFLLPVLIGTSLYSIINWLGQFTHPYSGVGLTDINAVFYNEFFTILILADVFILLLSFRYTERYSQLIRNTGFIICAILIRLSFAASGLTNVVLIVSSVLFGLLILKIYQAMEKPASV